MPVFDTVDPGATRYAQFYSLVVLSAPDAVSRLHRHGNYHFADGITQLTVPSLCLNFRIRMNAAHQCTNRHRTLVMPEPRFFVCTPGLYIKNTATGGAGQWYRFACCGFVSSDKRTVVGIGEIAFHHSHTSLLKHTARSKSRQSKAKDDGGFWPPVSVSILIIFSPLQSDTAQAHSIPLRAKGLGKSGGMTAERVIGYLVNDSTMRNRLLVSSDSVVHQNGRT